MAENSAIEWTDHSFNAWEGCMKVSPGCKHCYAETRANRFNPGLWGPAATTPRLGRSEAYWKGPLKWDRAAGDAGLRERVFCFSLADVFEDHPQVVEWRERFLELVECCTNLDWLLLTKRPENVLGMVPESWREQFPSNVWMGTSVEDQQYADIRIPELLKIPAAIHFLSCEPLLGSVDISNGLPLMCCSGFECGCQGMPMEPPPYIDWVIVGGESGPNARPVHPDWARSIRDQCQAAGVPFLFKQWGAWAPHEPPRISMNDGSYGLWQPNRTGGDPLDAFVASSGEIFLEQAMGGGNSPHMVRVGKKRAGRELDGRTWDEFPQPTEVST